MSPLKPAPNAPIVYLALGSNLGDRQQHLRRAVEALRVRAGAEIVASSSLYATEAVGIEDGPEFLNAVVGLRTALPPEELLRICLGIELAEGRVRGGAGCSVFAKPTPDKPQPAQRHSPISGQKPDADPARWGQRAPPVSRPLDLDVLLYGDLVLNTPDLILPHPRIHERAFVLAPLAEIAPDLLLRGRTVAAWAAAVGFAGVRRLPGTENWTRSADV